MKPENRPLATRLTAQGNRIVFWSNVAIALAVVGVAMAVASIWVFGLWLTFVGLGIAVAAFVLATYLRKLAREHSAEVKTLI